MNKIIFIALFCFSALAAAFTCPNAVPTNDANFCPSFKSVAKCHCTASGLPAGMCDDMTVLYNRLISVFGSLRKVCEFQHYTTTQDCIDNWNCYRLGGTDSTGKICSATGVACQKTLS